MHAELQGCIMSSMYVLETPLVSVLWKLGFHRLQRKSISVLWLISETEKKPLKCSGCLTYNYKSLGVSGIANTIYSAALLNNTEPQSALVGRDVKIKHFFGLKIKKKKSL